MLQRSNSLRPFTRKDQTRRSFMVIGCLVTLALIVPNFASAGPPVVTLEEIVTGLGSPVGVRNAGDGSNRLFIVDQQGIIQIWDGTQLLSTPFLDIQDDVLCCGERGLLGLAFDPDYATNGFFYVDYIDLAGDTVIASFSVTADPNVADPASETILLTFDQPFGNHNGGDIAFGPDGYLYIASGDGGMGGDPNNQGQTLSTLLGKILRIEVDGANPYTIPADNPFVGVVAGSPREEIWAYGLRNPWRISFDRETGDFFVADVGQGSLEEVNYQPASSAGGENYGWRLKEGTSCFNPPMACDPGGLTDPITEYPHVGGDCSITGGYMHRGTDQTDLNGWYFFADFCTGILRGTRFDAQVGWQSEEFLDNPWNVTSFGEGEDGEVYIVRSGQAVYRLLGTLPNDLFQDGFESGNTAAWSSTIAPKPPAPVAAGKDDLSN